MTITTSYEDRQLILSTKDHELHIYLLINNDNNTWTDVQESVIYLTDPNVLNDLDIRNDLAKVIRCQVDINTMVLYIKGIVNGIDDTINILIYECLQKDSKKLRLGIAEDLHMLLIDTVNNMKIDIGDHLLINDNILIPYSEFDNTQLKNTKLNKTQLENTEFENTQLENTQLDKTKLENTKFDKDQVRVIGISGAPALPFVATLVIYANKAHTLLIGDRAYTLALVNDLPDQIQVAQALTEEKVITAIINGESITASNSVNFTVLLFGKWANEHAQDVKYAVDMLQKHILNFDNKSNNSNINNTSNTNNTIDKIEEKFILGKPLKLMDNILPNILITVDEQPVRITDTQELCKFFEEKQINEIPAGTKISSITIDDNGFPQHMVIEYNGHKLTFTSTNGLRKWAEIII